MKHKARPAKCDVFSPPEGLPVEKSAYGKKFENKKWCRRFMCAFGMLLKEIKHESQKAAISGTQVNMWIGKAR